MLAIDRKQRRRVFPDCLGHQIPGGNERFLIGQCDCLASFDGGHRGLQSGAADDGSHDQLRVPRGGFDQCVGAGCCAAMRTLQSRLQLGQASFVRDDGHLGVGPARGVGQGVHVH